MTTWATKSGTAVTYDHPKETRSPQSSDQEYQDLTAAIADGSIPTFSEQSDGEALAAIEPIDPKVEREAYAALLEMINHHKHPGTETTYLDPDTYMDGLI